MNGDDFKLQEARYDQQIDRSGYVIARLDGHCFHTWTKGLKRPFDVNLQNLMDLVTMNLIREYNPVLGYTQSDEISLIFYPGERPFMFNGRVNKLNSILAATATAIFNKYLWSDNLNHAIFDCRLFTLERAKHVYDYLQWRQDDAKKNAVSLIAQSHYSHKELMHVHTPELIKMIEAKGDSLDNYSTRSKVGAYFVRAKEQRTFTESELTQLPEKHQARQNPDMLFTRTVVRRVMEDGLEPTRSLL